MESLGTSLLNSSAGKLRLSATLEINELVKQHEKQGRKITQLGFGEATFPIQKDVLRAHREASSDTSYLPVAGLPELRESIARFQSRRLGCTINGQQVVIAPGSKPLLFALFDILRGDVLLPRPSWVSYEPQVLHAGKNLTWVETDENDRHNITETSLQAAYNTAVEGGAEPRIMLINSPSNPTGQVFSKETLVTITTFCRAHNITLISDEIYSDVVFDETRQHSACGNGRFGEAQMIMTGGLSKTYSAGGWRVGFAIFPSSDFGTTVQKAVLAYASECWSAASAPAQAAAAVAFSTSPEMDLYRNQVSCLHRHCTLRLYEALKTCGLAVSEPQGAFYVYPSFHPYTAQLQKMGIYTSHDLSRWLISECGVAALPGSAFGEDDDGLIGGTYRLRMASSYLYFSDDATRYSYGYELLELAHHGKESIKMPLLEDALLAIRNAVDVVKSVR